MTKLRFASIGVALLMSAGTAIAEPVTYVGDIGHASVRTCWSHFGVSSQCAYFKEPEAQLVYDDANPEKSSLNVTFQTAKIETLVPVFNGHITGEKWFDAQKYPTATFKSTKIEKTGEKTGKVTGDLTIKGVTKPVTLDVTLNFAGMHPYPKNGPSLGFSAKSELKRSDFGLGALAPAVSDAVTLEVNIEFNKKA